MHTSPLRSLGVSLLLLAACSGEAGPVDSGMDASPARGDGGTGGSCGGATCGAGSVCCGPPACGFCIPEDSGAFCGFACDGGASSDGGAPSDGASSDGASSDGGAPSDGGDAAAPDASDFDAGAPVVSCTPLGDAGVCGDLGCECCGSIGPSPICLCTSTCRNDDDCDDPERPFCNRPSPDASGVCTAPGFSCCWLCG